MNLTFRFRENRKAYHVFKGLFTCLQNDNDDDVSKKGARMTTVRPSPVFFTRARAEPTKKHRGNVRIN